MTQNSRVRISLPYQLQILAGCDQEIELTVVSPLTVLELIRTLESRYPMLRGAIIEHGTDRRRPLIRFFACSEDISTDIDKTVLPDALLDGREAFMIVGAIAGG